MADAADEPNPHAPGFGVEEQPADINKPDIARGFAQHRGAPGAQIDVAVFDPAIRGMRPGHHVVDHGFGLLEREAVRGSHVDRLLFAGAGVARRHIEDAIGVDQKSHFDAGHPGRHGSDVFEIETQKASAILRQFPLALHNMNEDVGLAVHSGGEGFAGG